MLSMAAADAGCKLDLGFVVDTTKSIKKENVPKLKRALKLFLRKFDVSEDGTHVSLETFAKDSEIHNYFKDTGYYSEKEVVDLIDSSIGKLTKPTRLDHAIQKADEDMFTEESGDRPGVRSVMLLFTDGRSHPNTNVFQYTQDIKDIKSKGVRLVVVAIGPDARKKKYRAVLDTIAGKELFFADDYDELEDAVGDITALICPPNPCEDSPGMDVAFVVDRTKSVRPENFKLVKGFLLEICDALSIGPNATHTGFVLFAKSPNVLNTFADSQYYSSESVHHLIQNIPENLGSRTFIDRALKAANNSLFTDEGGDRPDFPNVLILLTDGKTNPDSEPFSGIISSLKAKGVRIVAIGVGNYQSFEGQLEEIAGEKVYNATNFDQLSDLFSEILKETCSVDGGFSRWSFWSDCSVTCGEGFQTRTRTCTNPPPQGKGKDCDGDLVEERPCNEGDCPEEDTPEWINEIQDQRHKSDPGFFEYSHRLPQLEREWNRGHFRRHNPKFPRKLREKYSVME